MFKDKVKELREEYRFSQYALAEKLNVSQSAIASWESGRREPPIETLRKIADLFNVSLDYLLGKSEYKNFADEYSEIQEKYGIVDESKKPATEGELDNMLIEQLLSLSSEDMQLVEVFLKGILEKNS